MVKPKVGDGNRLEGGRGVKPLTGSTPVPSVTLIGEKLMIQFEMTYKIGNRKFRNEDINLGD